MSPAFRYVQESRLPALASTLSRRLLSGASARSLASRRAPSCLAARAGACTLLSRRLATALLSCCHDVSLHDEVCLSPAPWWNRRVLHRVL